MPKKKHSKDMSGGGVLTQADIDKMTYRMTINLPHNRKMVIRVNPQTPLSEVFNAACTQDGLEAHKFVVQSTQLPGKSLDVSKSIKDLKINEISLIPKSMDVHRSLPDLRGEESQLKIAPDSEQPTYPEYMPTETRKKKNRILSFFSKKDRKLKLNDSVYAAPSAESSIKSRSLETNIKSRSSLQDKRTSMAAQKDDVSKIERTRPMTMYASIPCDEESSPPDITVATNGVSHDKSKLDAQSSSENHALAMLKQRDRKKRVAPRPPTQTIAPDDVNIDANKDVIASDGVRKSNELITSDSRGDKFSRQPAMLAANDAINADNSLDADPNLSGSVDDSFDVTLNGSLLDEIQSACLNKDIVLPDSRANVDTVLPGKKLDNIVPDADSILSDTDKDGVLPAADSEPRHTPHSRNSSDSSGYHEASISETGSPEVVRTTQIPKNLKTNSLESTSTDCSDLSATYTTGEMSCDKQEAGSLDAKITCDETIGEPTSMDNSSASIEMCDKSPSASSSKCTNDDADDALLSIPSLRSQYAQKDQFADDGPVVRDDEPTVSDEMKTFLQEKSDAIDRHRKTKYRAHGLDITKMFDGVDPLKNEDLTNEVTVPRTEPTESATLHDEIRSRPCAFVPPPPPPDTPPPLPADEPVVHVDKMTSVSAESPSLNSDDAVYTFPSGHQRHGSWSSFTSHMTADMNQDFEHTIAMATELWGSSSPATSPRYRNDMANFVNQMTTMTNELDDGGQQTTRKLIPLHHMDSFYSDDGETPADSYAQSSHARNNHLDAEYNNPDKRPSLSSESSTSDSIDSQTRRAPEKTTENGRIDKPDPDGSIQYSDEEVTTIVEEVIFSAPPEVISHYKMSSGTIPDFETAKEHRPTQRDASTKISLKNFPVDWDDKDEVVKSENVDVDLKFDALTSSKYPGGRGSEYRHKNFPSSRLLEDQINQGAIFTATRYNIEPPISTKSPPSFEHKNDGVEKAEIPVLITEKNRKKEREEFVFSRDDLNKVAFAKPTSEAPRVSKYGAYVARPYHAPRIEFVDKTKPGKTPNVTPAEKADEVIVGQAGTVRGVRRNVKNKCDELEFKPTNDSEVETVLEEKSISMLNLPSFRDRPASDEAEEETQRFTSMTQLTLQKPKTDINDRSRYVMSHDADLNESPQLDEKFTVKNDTNAENDHGKVFKDDGRIGESDAVSEAPNVASLQELQQQMASWQQQLLQNQAMLGDFRIVPDDQTQQMQQLQMQLQLQQQMMLQLQQNMHTMSLQNQQSAYMANPTMGLQPNYSMAPNLQPFMFGMQPNLLASQPNILAPRMNIVAPQPSQFAPQPDIIPVQSDAVSSLPNTSMKSSRVIPVPTNSGHEVTQSQPKKPSDLAHSTTKTRATSSASHNRFTPANTVTSSAVIAQPLVKPSSVAQSKARTIKSREGDKRFERKLTPREELMVSIKSAGGYGCLKTVSVAEAHWSSQDVGVKQ